MKLFIARRVGYRLGRLLAVSGVSQWLVTVLSFLLGYIFSHGSSGWQLLLGCLYFSLPYNLLIHGTEIRFAQSKPLLPRRFGLLIATINLPLLAALFATGVPAARLWLIATVIAAAGFGLKHIRLQDTPLLDGLAAGFLVTSPLVYAALNLGWQYGALPAAAGFFLWGMAQYVFGSLRFFELDRASGVNTTATALGQGRCILLSVFLFVLSALIVARDYGLVGILTSLVMILYAANATRFYGVNNPELLAIGYRFQTRLNQLFSGLGLLALLFLSRLFS